MGDTKYIISDKERTAHFRAAGATPQAEYWTASAQLQGVTDFETVLLAIACHDLRQPLQVVQSAYELLGIGLRTSSELKHLRLGQNAIDRLKEQLAQLLTALRIRRRTGTLELVPVRVQQILNEACRENEEAALRKGISLSSVATEAVIKSDSFLLGAALRNLISNAIKYTKPGGRILVGCRRYCKTLRIDVYDTGIGIPDEHMPRIFEACTRLDTIRCDGLGVGLFIVRQALGLLGHRIEVASNPSRGSRFSIVTTRVEPPGHL
jgi:two-component system phosphate regulon sensor histidine kinase PhoR